MLCLISEYSDPYFNLAAEEYFLKSTDEELFMLYINNPSIVAGKHQNLLAEINLNWVRENNILLARRISGGGTVYHDQGNLNFSFISNCSNLENISYKRFTLPIVLALNSLGIKAVFSGLNDLKLENGKISGNAMHIYKNRVLSHGTLLYKSNLHSLSSALKNHPERYIDKSIKSIPSRVVNISEFLFPTSNMTEFVQNIYSETCKQLAAPQKYILSKTDIIGIEQLALQKYSTWDWIYGYSPKYVFKNELILGKKAVYFQLNVEKGIIRDYSLTEDFNSDKIIKLLFDSMINSKHDYQTLLELFSSSSITDLFAGISVKSLCNQFF